MKKLYLVDVSSMFFRAFFAIPRLSNDKGMPTNALYGFLAMSIKLLRELKPDYIVYCFDTAEPTFRHEMYEDYKANRDEMPEDLAPQLPYVRKLSEALGVPILDCPGFEADDLIGTMVKKGRAHGLDVYIVSGDKDFAQLIDGHVTMYDTMKDVRYNPEGAMEKWGVRPDQMIDYLALVGDSSDNVPGVRGIGPKGAQKLLQEFKTLEGVYKNLDKITGKSMKAKLEEDRENAMLSKKLVTIKCDVPIKKEVEDFKLKTIDRDHLRGLLLELGFKTFARNLTGEGAAESTPTEETSNIEKPAVRAEVTSRKSKAIRKGGAIEEKRVTLAEADKLIKPYSEIWGLLDERGIYLGVENQVLMIAEDAEKIGSWISQKNISWRGYDLKNIWHQLKVKDPVAAWDSMMAAYVLKTGSIGEFSKVHEEYLSRPCPDLMNPAELYQAQLDLASDLDEKIEKLDEHKVLKNIELPLIPVLYAMERHGIGIDRDFLGEQSKSLDKDITALEKAIHDYAGGPFNVGSPKQLAQILFGKLGLTPGKKTKTGYSTDSDVLEELKAAHPIAAHLLEYRELSKLKSTYVDALPLMIDAKTGRIHTRFNQAGTSTGRLSSINPNLQNIPIRTERGRLVRKAFIAGEGAKLVSADYSQIELRILAHISNDKALQKAFAEDLDVHTATAAEIFGVKPKDVDAELRRRAKAVNFGIAYGQGAFGLAESLGIGRKEATEIIDRYFARFSGVKEYMQETVLTATKNGYVETLFGRRRYLDELKSKNGAIRKFGERAAINAPIQGTASDLVKLAMIKLHEDVSSPMLLQVHDELLFEAKNKDVETLTARIRKNMEGVKALKVPLKVNVAAGPNWEDAHS